MWKIQITIANSFISSKDNDEERAMHSKSDKTEIMLMMKEINLQKTFLIHLKIDIKIS